jgi:hypothetical protein
MRTGAAPFYRRAAAAKKKGPVYAIRPAQRGVFRSGGFCRENDRNGAKVAAIRRYDLMRRGKAGSIHGRSVSRDGPLLFWGVSKTV